MRGDNVVCDGECIKSFKVLDSMWSWIYFIYACECMKVSSLLELKALRASDEQKYHCRYKQMRWFSNVSSSTCLIERPSYKIEMLLEHLSFPKPLLS